MLSEQEIKMAASVITASYRDPNATVRGDMAWITHGSSRRVIGFRGTDGLEDWLTNLNARTVTSEIGTKVHQGFYSKGRFVLENYVNADYADWSDSILCGHSLGGAVA